MKNADRRSEATPVVIARRAASRRDVIASEARQSMPDRSHGSPRPDGLAMTRGNSLAMTRGRILAVSRGNNFAMPRRSNFAMTKIAVQFTEGQTRHFSARDVIASEARQSMPDRSHGSPRPDGLAMTRGNSLAMTWGNSLAMTRGNSLALSRGNNFAMTREIIRASGLSARVGTA